MIEYAKLGADKSALEGGPGTGQATEPIQKTGCDYTAVEIGDNFTDFLKSRFGSYDNFGFIHGDFELHDFGSNTFDLVYSAAAFQWITEKIGYPKAYDILKSGGTLAMFFMGVDTQPGGGFTDVPLYSEIQKVYAELIR